MPDADRPLTAEYKPPSADDDLLTVEQAAEEFGMHPVTLRKWIREGSVPATRPPGRRRWWIRRDELVAALQRRDSEHPSPNRSGSGSGGLATSGDRTVIVR